MKSAGEEGQETLVVELWPSPLLRTASLPCSEGKYWGGSVGNGSRELSGAHRSCLALDITSQLCLLVWFEVFPNQVSPAPPEEGGMHSGAVCIPCTLNPKTCLPVSG